MSNITQLKDKDGNNIYPISSDKLILDEQGRSIGERLTDHLENHPKGFSGDYNDLTNKPTIPTKVSQLSNDAGYITNADLDTSQNHVHSNMAVLNGITASKVQEWDNKSTFSGNYNDLTNKPTIPNISGLATETYVNNKVASLVSNAPETLDTLNELAQALGDDPNFATTVSNRIGEKADTSYVNTELAKKADTTYVDSGLAKKADSSDVTTKLSKKADTTYVDSELAKKATITYVNSEVGKKADTTYVNTELAKKSDVHDHPYKPSSYVPSWNEITSKPSTFAPSSHTHNEYALGTHTHSNYIQYEVLNGTVVVPTVSILDEE